MIRGSGFRGFISGWPGIIMISLSIITILICVCCWCTSIFYGRSKRRQREQQLKLNEQQQQEQEQGSLLGGGVPQLPQQLQLNPAAGVVDICSVPNHAATRRSGDNATTTNESCMSEAICPYPIDPNMDGMPRPI